MMRAFALLKPTSSKAFLFVFASLRLKKKLLRIGCAFFLEQICFWSLLSLASGKYMQQAAIPLNSCMTTKDKHGTILLTPKASYAYWKQAIDYARMENMHEMTMEEFSRFLALVDQEKLAREHVHPSNQVFSRGIASHEDGTPRPSPSDYAKAHAIRKKIPHLAKLNTHVLMDMPEWPRYNTAGVLDGKQNKKKQL